MFALEGSSPSSCIFLFLRCVESMTKTDSSVVDSSAQFADVYSVVFVLYFRVLFLCSRFPTQCSKCFGACMLVAEYCLKILRDSVVMC